MVSVKMIFVGLMICSLLIMNDGVACQNDCGVCHVDCSDNVMRACRRTHATITAETLTLTMEAYRSSNNSLSEFRELLNETYTPFFKAKYDNCTHPSYEEDKATNIHNPGFILILIFVFLNVFMVIFV